MRIRSIDFLRGMAILLVLCRHVEFSAVAHLIGWSGVDLFFVLSGFLVSGLLFNEYKKEKTIQPFRFLIRRGFKIYPLFWAVILYTVITHYFTGFGTDNKSILAELFFYQNYSPNTLFGVSWSLAVEEHFYLLLMVAVSLAVKFNKLENKKGFHAFCFTLLAYCLTARIITSVQNPEYNFLTHYAPTHLRIDALVFGVMLAYNYHFNQHWLRSFANKYARLLGLMMLACLLPLFFWEPETIFMRTIGFSLIYAGFGILLILVLMVPAFSTGIEKIITPAAYKLISRIGVYSYAIYLTHVPVLIAIKRVSERMFQAQLPNAVLFFTYVLLSLVVGMLLTNMLEKPVLKLREKLFPAAKSRVQKAKQRQIQTA